MNDNDKFEVDRVPSQKERILAVFLSSIILLIFTLILFFSISNYLSSDDIEKPVISLLLILLLFILSVILFLRTAFTKSRKPSSRAIKNVAYFVLGVSCVLIILPLFMVHTSNTIYLVSIGFTGFFISVAQINRVTKKQVDK